MKSSLLQDRNSTPEKPTITFIGGDDYQVDDLSFPQAAIEANPIADSQPWSGAWPRSIIRPWRVMSKKTPIFMK